MLKTFIINNVFKIINKSGYDAWFVGGCVRDRILGLKNKDYDICTNCSLEVIKANFEHIINIFERPLSNIYVIRLLIKDCDRIEHIDISTLTPIDMKELIKPSMLNNKLHFQNTYNDILLLKDALRRDFTINALYEDINGNIIDPTGLGVSDIHYNILRFIGEDYKTKLFNDPLIMLRFIRFLSTKDLTSYETLKSINQISKTLDYSKVFKELNYQN